MIPFLFHQTLALGVTLLGDGQLNLKTVPEQHWQSSVPTELNTGISVEFIVVYGNLVESKMKLILHISHGLYFLLAKYLISDCITSFHIAV